MLSSSSDFAGGDFCTLEPDGSLQRHPFEQGDLMIFQSHKYHCVQPVTSGTRQVFVTELWEGLERDSPAYLKQREERCSVFWRILEQRIPDIRERCDVVMEGTPLTHRRFLNVHNGSYGPALPAGDGLFPGVTTPVKGLWMCGASTFPGIGIPPVAASGALAAHGILGRRAQKDLLKELGI